MATLTCHHKQTEIKKLLQTFAAAAANAFVLSQTSQSGFQFDWFESNQIKWDSLRSLSIQYLNIGLEYLLCCLLYKEMDIICWWFMHKQTLVRIKIKMHSAGSQ